MKNTYIGRRFGAQPGTKPRSRWLRIPLRGALLCLMVSPVVVTAYQAFVWLNTGRWTWVVAADLLSAGGVSAGPFSPANLSELALYLAGLPLVGVLSFLAIAVYVLADLLVR